jgi:REP element-mobilizing transposase RayT
MNDKHHGCDLRKGRISLAGHFYLVTAVTYQRQFLFADLSAGRFVVREMMRSARDGNADTLAFVVMPDHLHWLFSLVDNSALSSVVGAVKRHSARKINVGHARAGRRVWQRGYHDHALRQDEDVARVARYVVANPLRAGLVKRIGDYPLWDAAWLYGL